MVEYALSTDLYTFAQATKGFFGWPSDTGEAEVIKKLELGDLLVPKFARSPLYARGEDGLEWQRSYCEAIGVDYDDIRHEYESLVAGGDRAVPFLLRVLDQMEDDDRQTGVSWARVKVEREDLPHPLSTAEFLRLRALPVQIAAQFKGTVAPGRHVQDLPHGVAKAVREASQSEERGDRLRQYAVVEASSTQEALERLQAAGRTLVEGDRVFIASPGGLLGVHDVTAVGELQAVGHLIPKTPDELEELFKDAQAKAKASDQFRASNATAAVQELAELLAGPNNVIPLNNFQRFHDRYTLLDRKITQALEIAKRPYVPPEAPPETEEDEEEADAEIDELAAVQGLDVEAVKKALPDYMVLPDRVLREAVTALRSGKHVLLSGPPGTGKSTLAEALCQAVEIPHEVVTATADWTTFDTIGGYMPSKGGLVFEAGIVLRCLQRGHWLVIDELNRADIDKAFGPLFTLLAGGSAGTPNPRVVLPHQRDGKNIEIRWAETRTGAKGDYILTPGWRLFGTLNVADKATLFQLSFAFLRRFAVVDVTLPSREGYERFFRSVCGELPEDQRENIVKGAMDLAFSKRQLGPAILRDVAEFVRKGLVETSAGTPTYADAIDAFLTAVRLFAVPQYEGAEGGEAAAVLKILQGVWPDLAENRWKPLRDALAAVTLS